MGLVRTTRNTHKSPLSPLRDIHKKHKKDRACDVIGKFGNFQLNNKGAVSERGMGKTRKRRNALDLRLAMLCLLAMPNMQCYTTNQTPTTLVYLPSFKRFLLYRSQDSNAVNRSVTCQAQTFLSSDSSRSRLSPSTPVMDSAAQSACLSSLAAGFSAPRSATCVSSSS